MTAARPAEPIRLYRLALSGHCHRVEAMLSLLGLPCEIVDVDLGAGEHKRPQFLALNRFGQVPVIRDGDVVLADSNAILLYLAQRYAPDSGWWPRDALGQARVQRWLSAAAGPLASGPAAARVIHLFGRAQDPSEMQQRARWLFEVMEQELGDGRWIAGQGPTIADLALYSYTATAPEGGISLEAYPRIRRWLDRVASLPGFVPMPRSAVGLAA